MQIQDGRYAGRFTGEVSVYENTKGSLVAAFGIEVEGQVRTWFATLVTADGVVSERRVRDLKTMLGWDGASPDWLLDAADQYAGCECEVEIINEPGNDGQTYSNIKYVDPPGGGAAGKLPEAMDKRTLVTKYAAKFRAIAGGAPTRPLRTGPPPTAPRAATPPLPAACPPPSRPPMAPPQQQTVTMEECWAVLTQAGIPGSTREQLEGDWFAMANEVAPGKQPADFAPADWARMKARIAEYAKANNDLPM
jgi:hypothetical protein